MLKVLVSTNPRHFLPLLAFSWPANLCSCTALGRLCRARVLGITSGQPLHLAPQWQTAHVCWATAGWVSEDVRELTQAQTGTAHHIRTWSHPHTPHTTPRTHHTHTAHPVPPTHTTPYMNHKYTAHTTGTTHAIYTHITHTYATLHAHTEQHSHHTT